MYGEGIEEKREESFNAALEKHFYQFDAQEDEDTLNERIEVEAMKKYQKIKEDQDKRLKAIQSEIEEFLEKGNLIEKHTAEVQAIIDVV